MTKEVESLNASRLDIAELEQRLELASALPAADCWANICGVNFG